MPDLIVVVPADRVSAMLKQGKWVAGRCNAYTTTLFRHFPTSGLAMEAGQGLPKGWVWGVEGKDRD